MTLFVSFSGKTGKLWSPDDGTPDLDSTGPSPYTLERNMSFIPGGCEIYAGVLLALFCTTLYM
jgi:hypothetical protein